MRFRILTIALPLLIFCCLNLRAENGYDLWLRYTRIEDGRLQKEYLRYTQYPVVPGNSATARIIRDELARGLSGLLGKKIIPQTEINKKSSLLVFVGENKYASASEMQALGKDGFLLKSSFQKIQVLANTETAALYGVFHLLRLMQNHSSLDRLQVVSIPRLKWRMLNHWDNMDRTVERGYAGFSLWDWHRLPGYLDQRYIDYARANASIGINAVVLNNVNANATILQPAYLEKVAALANLFRPYGIKVFLTARFSAPIEIGKLPTADPLDKNVREWWKKKAEEIYKIIPDFGGFLVKANSEGQPGPQDYKRTHAEGANMLAEAVAPHNGIVIWRAFVYAAENPVDRHKQAYDDFHPLDGKFLSNVMVQVKNGAIDFMPREPFHPLFGAMPKTPLMMEFQVTQEYLGQATHWVFLAPLFEEVLDADTYAKGKGSTVAKVLDGRLDNHALTGMAGVSNIGNDINWCGHPMAQANWYALGRLAWDHQLGSEEIANEWIRMTLGTEPELVQTVKTIMLRSREILVDYMNPLGLHHIMATGHHYGPGPWVKELNRPEWNPVYYHKADKNGIGFNRTQTGSDALAQYFPEVREAWKDPVSIDEKLLLWFHHVPWDFKMRSGRTLWEEMGHHYQRGVDSVGWMIGEWAKVKPWVDAERHEAVRQLLLIQQEEAWWWHDACLLYFQSINELPWPSQHRLPKRSLDEFKKLRFPFAPGN